jgi:hypothetical protein
MYYVTGTTGAVGKGKKKTSGEEKDTAIYPTKANSVRYVPCVVHCLCSHCCRNLYLYDFYSDFKKKHPNDKLMKSVFDAAFNKLTPEDLAVRRCFP